MKAAGLVPMGENGSYFQPITLTEMTAKDSSFMNIAKDGGDTMAYTMKENAVFWTKRYTDSATVADSELVLLAMVSSPLSMSGTIMTG